MNGDMESYHILMSVTSNKGADSSSIKLKVEGPYPSRGVGGVLISLSLAVEPVGG